MSAPHLRCSLGILLVFIACSKESLGKQGRLALRRMSGSDGEHDRIRESMEDHADISPEYIWGRCDAVAHNVSGCGMVEGYRCNSLLSDGPADADVTLELIELPPSTATREVHLHFWAAFPSETPYELDTPEKASVFRSIKDAYPRYDEEAFNGGNVRVNESGSAIIRVRRPASYQVSRWILYPHIHFRLCSGDSFLSSEHEQIFFSTDGPMYISGFHGHNHSLASLAKWAAKMSDDDATSAADGEGNSAVPVDDPGQEVLIDLRVQDAKRALDLDALEFSPVYRCLLDDRFYSYFSDDCVDACPDGAELVVGQCVMPSISTETVELETAWNLEVECAEKCWHSRLMVTLHHIRLVAADALRIPFQEVASASLALAKRRRLASAASEGVQSATLQVVVRSRRVDKTGQAKLEAMLRDIDSAEWLLGFTVHAVEPRDGTEGARGEEVDVATADEDSDPYGEAYRAAAEGRVNGRAASQHRGAKGPTSPMDVLETLLAACCVVLTGVLAGLGTKLYRCYQKRQTFRAGSEDASGIPVVQGRPVGSYTFPEPIKPGRQHDDVSMESTGPTKCSKAVPADLAEENHDRI